MSDRTTASTALTGRAGFLISQIGSHSAQRFAQRLAPLGLQPRHFGLLVHLAAADGQTQQQLADSLSVHRNAMVGLVDDLEERGLVERRRHPADRRAHAVHLTAAARELLPHAQQAADVHEYELLCVLNDAEQSQLQGLLDRIAEHAGLVPGVHPGLGAAREAQRQLAAGETGPDHG